MSKVSGLRLENDLFYRVLRKAEGILISPFQPHKKEWLGPARRALKSLSLGSYDVVLTCSQPPISHLLGYDLRKTIGIPWVAYFSDPWIDGPYRQGMALRTRRYNGQLEAEVVNSADIAVYPTDEMRQLVLRKYAPSVIARSETLDHCFVPEWYDVRRRAAIRPRSPVRVVHAGNFYGPRSGSMLWEVLADMRAHRGTLGRSIVFELYGELHDGCKSQVEHLVRDGVVRLCGKVDYLTSLAVMRDADVLLLVDAPAGDGTPSIFFPSKLADYLGARKPILGVTPTAGASARILRESSNIVVDVHDRDALSDGINESVYQQCDPESNKMRSVDKYDYRSVGARLVSILESACNLGKGLESVSNSA